MQSFLAAIFYFHSISMLVGLPAGLFYFHALCEHCHVEPVVDGSEEPVLVEPAFDHGLFAIAAGL